jgi:D-hydroxyproline dehydrogenase subunit beta
MALVEQDKDLPGMAATISRLRGWGLECSLLTPADLREVEPSLAPDLPGGAYFPGDGMVNPLAATRALAQAACSLGAEISTQTEVVGIEKSADGAVTGVFTSTEHIRTGNVVIAAGAWSAKVGQMVGINLPIQPRKGILVVTAPLPDDFLRCKVVLSAGYMDSIHAGTEGVSVAANIQQVKNGNLLLGTSRQFAGFDFGVESEIAGHVLARCMRLLPRLKQVQVIRMWAGLRPFTPDLLPIIGPVRSASGLYVAAGHEGIGITEAPITGKLIQQMIAGEEMDVDVKLLSPERFQ